MSDRSLIGPDRHERGAFHALPVPLSPYLFEEIGVMAVDQVACAARALSRPFTVGALTSANRIVMAPMTREFSPGGVPGAVAALLPACIRARG